MHDDLARLEMGKLPGWNSSSNLADMISAGARGHTHTHTQALRLSDREKSSSAV